jgi:hypothetical protein
LDSSDLTLTSPGGRYDHHVGYDNGNATADAYAQLPINTEDGTYTAVADFYSDSTQLCCERVQTPTIAKFVKITNTTASMSSIHLVNDSMAFAVSVLASDNCGGGIQVGNGMSGISDLTGITNTPESGSPVNGTAYKTLTLGGGTAANINFTVATGSSNTASGTLTLTGFLNSIPGGCTAQGPDAGNSASKNVTITNP